MHHDAGATIYAVTYGRDAVCGPEAFGDGWACTEAHRPHRVEFNGSARSSTATSYRVELFGSDGVYSLPSGSLPLATTSTRSCSPCNESFVHASYPTAYSSYEFTDDQVLWLRQNTWSGTSLTDSGFFGFRTGNVYCDGDRAPFACPGRSFHRVLTASEVRNEPPSVHVLSPAPGSDVNRVDAENAQRFTIAVLDREHHNVTAHLEVYAPGASAPFFEHDFPKTPEAVASVAMTTPPVVMPHVSGRYTIKAFARDTSGTATARSQTVTSTFDYTWNRAPRNASQSVPGALNSFPADTPLAFVARAGDPEGDPYVIKTLVGDRMYESYPTASGREAVTVIPEGFPPTDRPQRVVVAGQDRYGARGEFEDPQFITVAQESADANEPPGRPTLVAPTAGARFAAGAPQVFVVRATDPDGHRVQAVVDVRNASGTTVAQFATARADSGAPSKGQPVVPLPPGGYSWSARAFDEEGALGPPSVSSTFSVASDGTTFPSDDCATGTNVATVTAAGHYGKLQAKGNDVCFRVDGPAAGIGGKLTATVPGVTAPPIPTVDSNVAACTTPHASGAVGDPSDPATYVPFRIASSSTAGETSVCLSLGTHHRRVRLRFPGSTTPGVALRLDPPGSPAAVPAPPSALPSSACSGRKGSQTYVDTTLLGPVHTHLVSWRESPTRVHVCGRVDGIGPNVGGRLTIDTTGQPGIAPVLTNGSDLAACDTQVGGLVTPVFVRLSRSQTGANPASLCLETATTSLRLTAGTSGGASAPAISWTPDPGTPGL